MASVIGRSAAPAIGVFDSGFGGLTVLRALIERLPRARYAFLGDTARLPYGSKSRRTIARYAAQSARFLVREQGAEFLVIACNTASALALDAIQDAVDVPVLGVIEPGAAAARAASKTGDVLVIATDATVRSHAYSAACSAQGLRAFEKACPLLVPLVEEGWTGESLTGESLTGERWTGERRTSERRTSEQLTVPDARARTVTPALAAQAASAPPQVAASAPPQVAAPQVAPPQVAVTAEVIRIYLDALQAEAAAEGLNADTLVLGCTHYPLLRPLIEQAVALAAIRVIDSAESTAEAAARLIDGQSGSSSSPGGPGGEVGGDRTSPPPESHTEIRCFATDSVDKFEWLGSRFLGRPVGRVELIDLGG